MTLFGDKRAMAYHAGKASDEDSTFRFGHVYVRLGPSARIKEACRTGPRLHFSFSSMLWPVAACVGKGTWKASPKVVPVR